MILIDAIKLEKRAAKQAIQFNDRIMLILAQQKRTKSWLAEEIGISKQALNYLLKHSPIPKMINEIAVALGVSPEWLKTGKGKIILDITTRKDVSYIPLINQNKVYDFCSDNLTIENTNVIATESHSSNDCFAIILENTSMEPVFQNGAVLIFNKKLPPKSSDFVIFSLKKSKETFFRQFYIEGNDLYLKSCNNMYKTIKNDEIIIHGILVESRNTFK